MKIYVKLIERTVRFPKTVLCLLGVVTVCLGFFAAQITVDDSSDIAPKNDPVVQLTQRARSIFGNDQVILVVIEADEVFCESVLNKVAAITHDIEEIEGVKEVISPVTTENIVGSEFGMEVKPLLEDVTELSSEKIAQFRQDLFSNHLFVGNLVSEDGKTLALTVRQEEGTKSSKVLSEILDVLQRHKGKERIYAVGSPVIDKTIAEYINLNMSRLLPFVLLVILFTFYLSFRSIISLMLPFANFVMIILWTLGTMALLKVPLTIISSMLPAVLVAVGSSNGLHILTEYCSRVHEGKEKSAALIDAMQSIGPTIGGAGITTIIGFGSLALSDVKAVQEFGIFTAIGTFFDMVVTVLLFPSALMLLKPPKISQKQRIENGAVASLVRAIG